MNIRFSEAANQSESVNIQKHRESVNRMVSEARTKNLKQTTNKR